MLVPRRAWLLLALAAIPLTYIQVHDAITDLKHGEVANTRRLLPAADQLPRRTAGRRSSTSGGSRCRSRPGTGRPTGWRRRSRSPAAGSVSSTSPTTASSTTAGSTAASYRAWLQRLAVRYVAVADAPADYSRAPELKLIAGGLPYLKLVAHLPHWTVYAVAGATPLASGAARVTRMGPNSLSLASTRPGSTYLRVRWSPYWRLTGVRGCVERAGDFTRIQTDGSGRARLMISFSIGRIGASSPRCELSTNSHRTDVQPGSLACL